MKFHKLASGIVEGSSAILAHEPEFDLYKLRRVLQMDISWLDSESNACEDYSLKLVCAYNGDFGSYIITIIFESVKMLKLPEFAESLYISELEFEDVSSSMLEGVKYEAISYTDYSFQCQCKNIRFMEPLKLP